MKKFLLLIALILGHLGTYAQCAMCTKTAAGLDDGAAKGLNTGIIFLAFMPLTIILLLAFFWFKRNKHEFMS